MHQLGAYELELELELELEVKLEPEPGLFPELEHRLGAYEPELKLEVERSHTHSRDSFYHPELQVNDYFPDLSRHGYHSGFNIFSPVPPQYNTPLDSYPPHYSTSLGSYPSQYSTPPSSNSSMAFRAYDFSSMFCTPSPATEENIDCREHSQHKLRPRRNIPLGPHHQTINFRGVFCNLNSTTFDENSFSQTGNMRLRVYTSSINCSTLSETLAYAATICTHR
ncbi:hypothetical protein PVK06_041138 [Gossypium arboreum]|uniref:Uncharacterized protein n=1 Tax=Gossypium arboreum TaxID=29729 RepID=A0ABR0N7Q2_GOSAR|nr:hypothetical protein PVK06_041138 [Gossypium arboreum]